LGICAHARDNRAGGQESRAFLLTHARLTNGEQSNQSSGLKFEKNTADRRPAAASLSSLVLLASAFTKFLENNIYIHVSNELKSQKASNRQKKREKIEKIIHIFVLEK